MKRLVTMAMVVITLTALDVGAADTFEIDNSHSSVGFKIWHLGISKTTGVFREFKGSWKVDPDTLKLKELDGTVVVKSVDTNVKARDKHLLNDDFFDEPNHPEMIFKFTDMKDDKTIVGEATIRGVTKKVEWTVRVSKIIDNPRDKGKTRKQGISISGTLNRKDFGVGKDFPDAIISDKLEVIIELEGDSTGKK